MARDLPMAEWSGDDKTVLTKSPWWKAEPLDTLPDLLVQESNIRDIISRPDDCDEPTTVMTPASQLELLQACQISDARWMVRNGSRKVGPVSTGLLIAGILAERVPASCDVRRVGSSNWQPLHQAAPFAEALAEVAERSLEESQVRRQT